MSRRRKLVWIAKVCIYIALLLVRLLRTRDHSVRKLYKVMLFWMCNGVYWYPSKSLSVVLCEVRRWDITCCPSIFILTAYFCPSDYLGSDPIFPQAWLPLRMRRAPTKCVVVHHKGISFTMHSEFMRWELIKTLATRVAEKRVNNTELRSSDFVNHPTSDLIQSAILEHDYVKFKIFFYSISHEDNSEWRKNLNGGVDHFQHFPQWMSDRMCVEIITKDGIVRQQTHSTRKLWIKLLVLHTCSDVICSSMFS